MPFFGVPIRNGLPIGLGSVAGFGVQQFDPSQLFEGGTVAGAWYDPSDLSTMFDTSAGTTPVSMPGQGAAVPVGAMLDKRATGYSLFFDGDGDYLSTPNSAALQFGTGDFTIEFWIYFASISDYQTPYDKGYSGAGGLVIQTGNGTGRMIVYASGVAVIGESGTGSTGTWIHYALVRNGSALTLYRDGVASGAATNSTNFNNGATLAIGSAVTAPQYSVNGYLSNFRIVKGTAVYTSAFTPPTAPLSPISGTSLLTCGVTWSGNPAITTVGNTRVNGLNPFTASPVGNHAIAFNNTTARPELSARVNLLTYSEDLTNAAWTKQTGTSVNSTPVADPNGALKAWFVTGNGTSGIYQAIAGSLSLGQSVRSVYLRTQSGTATVGIKDPAATQGTTTCNLTTTWQRFTLTETTTPTSGFVGGIWVFNIPASGIEIAWPDVRPANIGANVPAYQRIADANTYDTSGFPLYLRFDGIDDSMYTPASIPFATVTSDGQARRNLLSVPTLFNDAAWTKSNVSEVAGKLAPDGTNTAFEITATAANGILRQQLTLTGADYTFSIWLRRVSGTGSIGISAHTGGTIVNVTLTSSWQRFDVTQTLTAGVRLPGVRISTSGDVIEVWSAQLETGSTATAFQNIGTDKVAVFAGVRKLSDAAQGVVAELSATIASNNGTFLLAAPDGATQTYGWDSKGTTQVDAVASSLAAPRTNVLVGTADIAGDSCIIRVNGAVADTEAGDQGTGNFGTYPLYIGARNNASSWLNGQLYSLIIAGSAVSAGNISATEQWVAGKTGIQI